MANSSVTVRLSPRDIAMIDKKIHEGYFTSRSDVIRYSIRYLINDLESKERRLEVFREKAAKENISMKDIVEAVRKARKEVYLEVYGDD